MLQLFALLTHFVYVFVYIITSLHLMATFTLCSIFTFYYDPLALTIDYYH
eukprot:m.72501 g.72501  ORF g.72501 m.72501 type:complete len:50 (-) comp16103_c0_seq1:132-281(-)